MKTQRPAHIALFGLIMILVMGPAGAQGEFPEFSACDPNVQFWKHVYGSWSQGQVAVHDMDWPGVIYEVVSLPGPMGDSYTKQQQAFVDDLREGWEDRLEALAHKVQRRQALTDAEKALALQLTTTVGSDAVRGAHKRVRTQRGTRERFHRGLEISSRYDAEFRRIFREAGLPEDLALLPHVESAFQAAARSSAGAVGIWQFTRGTGRSYLTINSALDERLDPVAAAHGAAAYLKKAYASLGDWPIALTSYNYGVTGMKRAVRQHGQDYETIFRDYSGRHFGFASKNFYSEFLAAREIAHNPDQYFPEGLAPEPALDTGRIQLEARATPAAIASAYNIPLDELAQANLSWNKRTIRQGLAIPKGTIVWIPSAVLSVHHENGTLPFIQPGGIDGDSIYIVRRGDTLSGIARRYGLSLSALRELNGIPARSSLIRSGQKLNVGPAGNQPVHVVRAGETLGRIASRYHVRLGDLLRLNQLSAKALIHPGQIITIPR
jgi:membrane-bound lytic murein transglycosylase D